jgi:hypothetical protein
MTGDMLTFRPDGRTLEDRCREITRRRERWLTEHPGKHCVMVIHASQRVLGDWLTKEGIAWVTMPGKQPLPAEVRFADAEDK